MKRLALFTLLCMAAMSSFAQIPMPGDPVCAHCGVDLKSGEAHKSFCPYYEAPQQEESSSSSSTHLSDYTPLPEVSSTLLPFSVMEYPFIVCLNSPDCHTAVGVGAVARAVEARPMAKRTASIAAVLILAIILFMVLFLSLYFCL